MSVSLEDQQYALYINKLTNLISFIVLFGLFPIIFFLNILPITVFLRKKFRENYMNLYNLVISLVDNSIIFVNYFLFYQDTKNETLLVKSAFLCVSISYITRVFSSFHSWLLVMVSLERALHVIYPFSFKFMKKKRVILAIMLALFIANLVLYSPITYLRINTTAELINETNQTVVTKTCNSTPQIDFLIDTIRIMSRIVVPFILVLIFNSLLIYKLIKSKRKVKTKATTSMKREYNFSKIIAVTCFLFVLSFTPLMVFLLVININQVEINSSVRVYAVSELVKGFAHFFTLFNYLSQFMINLKFSSMFREESLIIFKGIKKLFIKQNF